MVKRFALLIASAALVSSSVGCCLTGCGYRGYGGGGCPPCGTGYSGYAPASTSPCGPGGCAPGGQSFYQGASIGGDPTMMTASPIIPGAVYPQTASFPIQSVPVY